MLLGVSLPLILLAFFECFYAFRGRRYQEAPVEGTTAGMSDVVNAAVAEQEGEARNKLAIKVIGVTLLCTGILILGLGIMANSEGRRVGIKCSMTFKTW